MSVPPRCRRAVARRGFARRTGQQRLILPPLCLLLLSLAPVIASRADDLPIPPVPPYPPPSSESAPVPNRASAPAQPLSEEPNLNLKLYRSQPPDPSLGFSPGSRYQSSEDRKAIQTPGLSLSVPLR
jgi:hypothetical protein